MLSKKAGKPAPSGERECQTYWILIMGHAEKTKDVKLYEEGLIYRGKYLVNWCPRCRTALSNEEAEPHDTNANLHYLRYPLEGGGHVTVATTRPETMLGDTAVAVNPRDPSKKDLVGKTAILPFVDRKIPIIADDHVQFGQDQIGSKSTRLPWYSASSWVHSALYLRTCFPLIWAVKPRPCAWCAGPGASTAAG